MHKTRASAMAATALVIAALTAGCTSAGGSAASADGEKQVISIGAPVTVSGDAAYVGLAASSAFEVAQKIIDADPKKYLGSASRSLKITTQDAGSTAAQAIAISREIVADPANLAIVGPSTSPQALALAPFAQQQSIPLVVPSSPAKGISAEGDHVFQIAMINDVLADAIVRHAVKDAHLKTVGVIYSPDNNADLVAGKAAIAALEDLGVKAVPFEIPFAEQDYSAAVTKMSGAGADGVFIATVAGGVATAMTQGQRVGYSPLWFGGPMFTSPVVLTNAGAAAKGALAATDYNPSLDTPTNVEFRKKFKEATGNEPDVYAAQAFTSVLVIAAAVKSLPADQTVTRDSLAKAIASVSGVDVPVGDGKLSISSDRTSELTAAILKLDGGTWASVR